VEVIVTIEEKDFVRNADLEELLKCANQVGELDTEPLTNRRAFMLRKSYNFLVILLLKTN